MTNSPRAKRVVTMASIALGLVACTETSLIGIDDTACGSDASSDAGMSATADASTDDASNADASAAPMTPEGTSADAGAQGPYDAGTWPAADPLDCEGTQSPMKIVAVAEGLDRRCAIAEGGKLYCWGRDPRGSSAHVDAPVLVAGLDNVSVVTLGLTHICALASGSVWCWGQNQFGQLGDGTRLTRAEPVKVEGLEGVVRLAAGGSSTCALTEREDLYCWGALAGNNEFGSIKRIDNVSDAQELSLGLEHACVTGMMGADPGRVLCFGENIYGQLGNGTNARNAILGETGVQAVSIAAGGWGTCAITPAQQVLCWGDNGYGQLGDGTFGPLIEGSLPARTQAGPMLGVDNPHRVSVSIGTICVHLSSGEVKCAGSNQFGALGTGDDDPSRTEAMPVLADAIGKVRLFEGGCIARGELGLECWGPNRFGSVGDGTTEDRYAPVPVRGFNCSAP